MCPSNITDAGLFMESEGEEMEPWQQKNGNRKDETIKSIERNNSDKLFVMATQNNCIYISMSKHLEHDYLPH